MNFNFSFILEFIHKLCWNVDVNIVIDDDGRFNCAIRKSRYCTKLKFNEKSFTTEC